MRTARRDRSIGVGVVVAMLLSLLVAIPPADATPRAGTPADSLRWSPCYKQVGPDFECALAPVPLDHDRPNGPTIQLSLVRLAATDEAARVGSLFVNPGGPGGSGVDAVLFDVPVLATMYGPEVRERFDIVGFDPRGIARSTAIRCFGNERQQLEALPPVPFPVTDAEEQLFQASDSTFAAECGKRGNTIAAHMSTANVARDLDLLRERAGDDGLTYLGLSYGSYLGVVYANMFPDRVRALVIDGVLDPVAWRNAEAEIPFTTRIRSDAGAQATLERFFELCTTAGAACPLAPQPADRFSQIADELRDEPIAFVDPLSGETIELTYQALITLTLGLLYDPLAYPLLAQLVAEIEAITLTGHGSPGVLAALLQQAEEVLVPNRRGYPNYVNQPEGFSGVGCTDSSNPTDYAVWSQAAAQADEEFGYFGSPWTWQGSRCAQWPTADTDRYDGDFDATTANPVLIASPRYDPATRVEGAQVVRDLLPNSALVIADMPGHTTLLAGSSCAGAIVGQYLQDPVGAEQFDGIVCPMEFNPFAIAPQPPQATELSASLRSDLDRR